jgi:hypothetical protein
MDAQRQTEGEVVKLTPNELRFVALHEAAHAVVAAHLGMPVEEIRIGQEPEGGEPVRAGTVRYNSPLVRAFRATRRQRGEFHPCTADAFRRATGREMELDAAYLHLCVAVAGYIVSETRLCIVVADHIIVGCTCDRFLDGYSGDADFILTIQDELGLSETKWNCLIERANRRAFGILIRRAAALSRLATVIYSLGNSGVLSREQVARILRTRQSRCITARRYAPSSLQWRGNQGGLVPRNTVPSIGYDISYSPHQKQCLKDSPQQRPEAAHSNARRLPKKFSI